MFWNFESQCFSNCFVWLQKETVWFDLKINSLDCNQKAMLRVQTSHLLICFSWYKLGFAKRFRSQNDFAVYEQLDPSKTILRTPQLLPCLSSDPREKNAPWVRMFRTGRFAHWAFAGQLWIVGDLGGGQTTVGKVGYHRTWTMRWMVNYIQ